jgi:phage baseplate assembly protein W
VSVARYRSFRFVLPSVLWREVDKPTQSAGLQVGPTGQIDMVEDDEAIRQAILMLLATSPGERVMRPDYGCLLRRVIFSPNDDTTAGLAIHYVRVALERWEPRIEILRIDAGNYSQRADRPPPEAGKKKAAEGDPDENKELPDDPEGMLVVSLEYRVRATQAVRLLNIPISLRGEGG